MNNGICQVALLKSNEVAETCKRYESERITPLRQRQRALLRGFSEKRFRSKASFLAAEGEMIVPIMLCDFPSGTDRATGDLLTPAITPSW